MEKASVKNLLGCLPKALLGNFIVGAAALLASIFLGGPKIYISLNTAIIVFCVLLVPYIILTWWSIWALARGGKNGALVTSGPYALSRNPMYAAVIFILNPALGILFRSWLLFLAVVPIYFIWQKFVRAEEKGPLIAKFGQTHAEYLKTTPRFWPDLRKINPVLFYASAGVLIFLVSFIYLNFSALYLRWVVWETRGKIIYDKPVKTKSGFMSSDSQLAGQSASYNPGPNAVLINKLNIRAPLISSITGVSQKELNEGLDQGVILYPGSALPGQNGEVVLSGHSSVWPWVKTQYGQVFTLLDKLTPGDTVSIIYNNWQYDYQITGQEILNPNQVKISDTDRQVIKLTTCWPVGTTLKRLVVYGELIE